MRDFGLIWGGRWGGRRLGFILIEREEREEGERSDAGLSIR